MQSEERRGRNDGTRRVGRAHQADCGVQSKHVGGETRRGGKLQRTFAASPSISIDEQPKNELSSQLRGCCASLLTSLNAIMNMPCGSQTQHPQPTARQQPHAAPPPAAAFATANSASPTNSSNASEHSSSYYHRPPRLSTNGTFEGGEHNSSSGYGSSAEAQVGYCSLHEVMYSYS